MNIIKRMIPYWCIILAAFYLLPVFIKNTGSAIIILLAAIPFTCFLCSVLYGIRNGLHWQYALAVAILFIPSVFLFYNSSAWVYSPGYGMAAFIGNGLGHILKKAMR